MVISDADLSLLITSKKIISGPELTRLETVARNSEQSLFETIIFESVLSEEKLFELVAEQFKLPFIKIAPNNLDLKILQTIPEKVAQKQKVVVFFRDKKIIKVAGCDQIPQETLDLLEQKTGQKVQFFFATRSNIASILLLYRKDLQSAFEILIKEAGMVLDEAPVTKIVDMLVDYAYQDKASDIHVEPEENRSLIRFRIDGVLHDGLVFPKSLHERIVTRIKVLSKLRTDEHMMPQDGKLRFEREEEMLDVRISIIPIVSGEKVVMRLLSSRSREYSLTSLGMNEKHLTKVQTAMKKSFGMILSTGPTGSGKTTSIYAIIKILNSREKNITTIEDPVEYRITGVNQIQVNPRANLTFSNGLTSILRQDPNIIFVGEIRDNQTAGIAVNAALTGHLVLTTLHTNDAVGALPRLSDMGVEPLLVAATINVIIAQRLLRKICESCKTVISISTTELAKNIPVAIIKKNFRGKSTIKFYKGAGCPVCHQTGYLGRVGIFEVLVISKEIRKLIVARKDSDEITLQAVKEGMTTMLDDGLQKAALGVTTLEEILRSTKTESL